MKIRISGLEVTTWAVLLLLLRVAGAAAEAPALGSDASQDRGRALTLEDVLDSVDRSYPVLLAVEVERDLTEAALLEARGSFDTRVLAAGEAAPTGYFDRYTGDLEVDQQTRLWGSRLFGGYRMGRGDFPSYLGGRKTNESGELRVGVEIPLLRDRAIDAPRTRLRASEIRRQRAEPQIEAQRIVILREASEAYWRWVANGLSVEVERKLLAIALARRDQLTGRVERGAIARILLVDNERLIVDRKIRLRRAEQEFAVASLDLSLFLRDASGERRLPTVEGLPSEFPPETVWGPEQVLRDIEQAQQQHPLLQELRLRRAEIETQLALARNSVLPEVRLRLEGSQDLGPSSGGIDSSGVFSSNPKDDTEVKALLKFELPVQQRGARGRVLQSRAELTRLSHETRFTEDRIETEIRRANTNLEAAFDQTILARENVMLAEQLKQAEERKLSLGSSNLIDVNIREVQATDAARMLIFAQEAYFQSLARYRAAAAGPFDPVSGAALAASGSSARSAASPR